MKWFLLILACLLAAAGLELRALRELAEKDCHVAQLLARRAPTVASWVREAALEPFLGAEALGGAPAGTISLYRARARAITSELSARLLPPELVNGLRRLELAPDGEPVAAALLALPAAAAACREPAPKDPAALGTIEAQVAEAERTWLERKAQVPADRIAFSHDRQIFCKGDKLILSLRAVADAAKKKCEAAKPGTKLAQRCQESGGHAPVDAEIRDVEKEKELNLRKLRQKWPARVIEGLQC